MIENARVYGLGINIRNYFHDNDGKVKNIVAKTRFSKSKEGLDKSHGVKNITKKINNKIWKEKIKKTLNKVLNECNKDPDKIREDLDKWLRHWKGDHSKCGGKCKEGQAFNLEKVSHEKLFKKIEKLLGDFAKKAEWYKSNITTSIVESMNRSLVVGVNKNIDFPMTYGGRIDGEIARVNEGETWPNPIFEDYKVPLNEKSLEFLDKMDRQRKTKYKTANSKEQRKKKRNKIQNFKIK